MDGSSFLKQMQNKVKNLRRKLEKIQEKEKRPRSELSEDEKTQLESKAATELLLSEYEKLLSSYLATRETPEIPKQEVRVEVREVDNTAEVLRLWAVLHFVGLPGALDLYLAQGLPREDFEEALELRTRLLGKPGDSVMDLYGAAVTLLTPRIHSKNDALDRVSKWCLEQKVPLPPPVPVLAVHSLPQHAIVREPEPVLPTPTEPVPAEPAAPIEEVKEKPTTWADEAEEEEAVEAPAAQAGEPEQSEDSDFTVVGGKPKRKKPVPEPRGGFGNRRRGNFRGDRRSRGRGQ